jgi:hypothetical protein
MRPAAFLDRLGEGAAGRTLFGQGCEKIVLARLGMAALG